MRVGVVGDCVPLPQCMLGKDNVHLLGYPLPDNPGGHDDNCFHQTRCPIHCLALPSNYVIAIEYNHISE
jgi:hypothetical protein